MKKVIEGYVPKHIEIDDGFDWYDFNPRFLGMGISIWKIKRKNDKKIRITIEEISEKK